MTRGIEEAILEFDQDVTLEEFVENTEFSYYQIRKEYGSWTEFKEAIYDESYNYKWDIDDYISDMLTAWQIAGEPDEWRMKDQELYGEIPPRAFIYRFDTWSEATKRILWK